MPKIRANVKATAAGATAPTDLIFNGDALGGLGSFGPTSPVPLCADGDYTRDYPVGWTNGGWFEGTGRTVCHDACVCEDCLGSHTYNYYDRALPDEFQDCSCVDPIGEHFDYPPLPKYLPVPNIGCAGLFDPTVRCHDFNPAHPPDGFCQAQANAGDLCTAGWPLAPFDQAAPSSRIRVVDDTSGPVGFEDDPAMEIDFSGAGFEGATFVGSGGGYDSNFSDACCTLTDSSVTQGLALGTDVRSNSGWTLTTGDIWQVLMSVKAVPDNDGFVCTGYTWNTRFGFWPNFGPSTHVDGSQTLVLDGTWQTYYYVFQWNVAGYNNAPFTMVVLDNNTLSACDQFQRKGRVHVKNATLSPLQAGLRVRRTTYRLGGI